MDKLDEKKCEYGCNHDHCDENCDCSNEPLILEMEDINGEKVKVQVIGTFDDSDKSYAIVNDLDNEDNSYIFEVQTTMYMVAAKSFVSPIALVKISTGITGHSTLRLVL